MNRTTLEDLEARVLSRRAYSAKPEGGAAEERTFCATPRRPPSLLVWSAEGQSYGGDDLKTASEILAHEGYDDR